MSPPGREGQTSGEGGLSGSSPPEINQVLAEAWSYGVLGFSENGPRASGAAMEGQEHPGLAAAALVALPRASRTGLGTVFNIL